MQLPEVRRVTRKETLHALATVLHYLEQNLTEYNEYYAIADKVEKTHPKIASNGKLQNLFQY